MSDSLQPHGLYSPWNSPGQNTRVGSLSLCQGIFLTQGSNPGLPHCRRILYQQSHQGSPRILEWVAYPFPSRCFWPRYQPGSPAFEADSLPTELSGKPTVKRSENQNTPSIWLIIGYVNAVKVWNSVSNTKSNWIVRPREKTCFSSEMDLYDSSIALNLLKYPKVLPYVNSPRKGFTH